MRKKKSERSKSKSKSNNNSKTNHDSKHKNADKSNDRIKHGEEHIQLTIDQKHRATMQKSKQTKTNIARQMTKHEDMFLSSGKACRICGL